MIRFMGAHKTSVCYFLKVAQHMETSVCSIFRARAIAAGDSPCFFLLMISPARLSPSALPSILSSILPSILLSILPHAYADP